MQSGSHTITKTLARFRSFRYTLILEGVAAGALAGLAAVAFRLLLEKTSLLLNRILAFRAENSWFIPLWMCILAAAAVLVTLLLSWEPYSSGSGIPQVKGEMAGRVDQKWWRVLPAKYAGGLFFGDCARADYRNRPYQ